jgi:hypothetical protein
MIVGRLLADCTLHATSQDLALDGVCTLEVQVGSIVVALWVRVSRNGNCIMDQRKSQLKCASQIERTAGGHASCCSRGSVTADRARKARCNVRLFTPTSSLACNVTVMHLKRFCYYSYSSPWNPYIQGTRSQNPPKEKKVYSDSWQCEARKRGGYSWRRRSSVKERGRVRRRERGCIERLESPGKTGMRVKAKEINTTAGPDGV